MDPSERRQQTAAVAGLLLLPTLLFADVVLGLANFAMRDLTRFYYPTKQIYREIVFAGHLPLWNRYFQGGQPLAANPEHAIFYPFTWLVMLPSYDLGYRLHILVHIYIALLGMYALLRSMRARPAAAFVGAVSWGLGGLYLSYLNLLPILFCAAWLPLTFLYVVRFLRERRRRDFALAALSLGLQFLVAEPTTVVQTGFLIGMYGLYRGWPRLGAMLRNTASIALISAAGFAVGAVQMLAAIDHAGDSARARPFDFEVVAAWSMPWPKLVELVFPNFLGHVQIGGEIRYWGSTLYESMGAPFLFSIYPGLAITALAAAGLACRARGSGFVVIVAFPSIILALGDHTPVLRILYDTGVFASVRYPEKFILMAVFVGTVFGALVLERILAGDERLRNATAGFALATALIAAAIVLLGFTRASVPTWIEFFNRPPDSETLGMIGLAWRGWSIAAARGFFLFLLFLVIRSTRTRVWWAAALLFLCADLLPVVNQLNPRLPRYFFTEAPEIVRTLPANRADYRIFHEADWYGGDQIGLAYPGSTARYWLARNGLFPAIPAGHGIRTALDRDYDETSLLPTVDLIESMWEIRRSGRPDWHRPLMAMSNVWYRAVLQQNALQADVEAAMPVRFQSEGRHPRYYLADQIVTIRDRRDFVQKLSSAAYSDRVAFVPQAAFVPAAGRVLRVRERTNSAVIDVEVEGEAFLVMSVTPHKYWRVTVGDRPVQPVVTNVGYQGVRVPTGRHQVVMRYRNTLIEIGAALSLIAATLLLAVISRRRTPVADT